MPRVKCLEVEAVLAVPTPTLHVRVPLGTSTLLTADDTSCATTEKASAAGSSTGNDDGDKVAAKRSSGIEGGNEGCSLMLDSWLGLV